MFLEPEDDHEPDDAEKLAVERMGELENEARKMGLYMHGFAVAHNHEDDTLALVGTFFVGEEAFDDRVLNPKKYEEDDEFRHLTTNVDPVQSIGDELRQRIADGKDPFSDDDDPPPPEYV